VFLAGRALGPEDTAGRRPTLAEVERRYIAATLQHARGNQTRAAELLGISRKALWEKRKRYGLD
jgi:DNA-binding NtrC family response regulator